MFKRDDNEIKREFRVRQTRQIIAMAAALFLVLLAAVMEKRTDLFGSIDRSTLFSIQAIAIAGFIGYTAVNWRCPSCGKHLGGDINRERCRKCGARLQ